MWCGALAPGAYAQIVSASCRLPCRPQCNSMHSVPHDKVGALVELAGAVKLHSDCRCHCDRRGNSGLSSLTVGSAHKYIVAHWLQRWDMCLDLRRRLFGIHAPQYHVRVCPLPVARAPLPHRSSHTRARIRCLRSAVAHTEIDAQPPQASACALQPHCNVALRVVCSRRVVYAWFMRGPRVQSTTCATWHVAVEDCTWQYNKPTTWGVAVQHCTSQYDKHTTWGRGGEACDMAVATVRRRSIAG